MTSRIQNDILSLAVAHLGAEMKSLVSASDQREWLWNGDADFWPRTAPVLFPIVGKLSDNQYYYQGRPYPLSQHGFARDRVFEAVEVKKESIRFLLKADYESHKFYPFDFDLYLSYTLAKNWLWIDYEVVNTDTKEMWFSIGGHPGFALPGWPQTAYSLSFEKVDLLQPYALKSGLIGRKSEDQIPLIHGELPITETLFEHDALVFNQLKSTWIGIQPVGKSPELKVHFEGFPWVGLWAKQGAPFVCIEPWFGHADPVGQPGELAEKPEVIHLDSGQNFHCRYALEILTY